MSKEGQKKVPTTEEGQNNVTRRSEEGPDNRRLKEGQSQNKVKRRSKEGPATISRRSSENPATIS